MAKPFFLIDGYNLMHAWGLARSRYGPGDLERLRERFLNELANQLREEQLPRTTIVFDAGPKAPHDALSDQNYKGLRLLYAVREPDADTRIEQLIVSHSAPRQVCVVSSDRRLQIAIRKRKGRFLTSDEFIAQLERAKKSEARSAASQELDAKFSGETTESEMAEWLEIFGDAKTEDE